MIIIIIIIIIPNKGTEVWIWKQFNKTKPDDIYDWNVTLSRDNYNLLIDAITTVARDTGKFEDSKDCWTKKTDCFRCTTRTWLSE